MLMQTPEKPTIITVGWRDIFEGTKVDPFDCMVARAAKRVYNTEDISVVGGGIRINGNIHWLPEYVCKKIRRWDSGKMVLPFSFELVEA